MTKRFKSKKIWLVNRDFQLRYTGAGLAAGFVSTLITAILILFPLFQFKIITVGFFLPWPIFVCIFAAAILNAFVQIAFGIVLTHKIAGPMFSLIKYLRLIEAGQWKIQMRQRQGDDLQIVVRHVNEMSEGLARTVAQDLESLEKIKSIIAAPTGDIGERDLLIAGIERLMDDMNQRISTISH
jgi:methyl-accepting chemotaxis protein